MTSSRTSSITIPLSPSIPPAPIFPWTLQELQQLGLWGDVPTTPTTTKRSYHHLVILKHHHHNNKYTVNNNNYNNSVKNTVSATHTQERSISSLYSNRSGVQYHQFSKILFFSNPSQPNHSSLLMTTRCGSLAFPGFS